MGKILTRKIVRNKLRKKYGNSGLQAAFQRYQNGNEKIDPEVKRGKNYNNRNYNKVR